MIGFIIRLAVSIFALFLVAHFSNGAIVVQNMTSMVIAALVLGFANAFMKPVLYFVAKKVTCVLSCITLGLWSLILSWLISTLIFYCAGQWLSGFSVRTFQAAFLGALVLAIFNSVASMLTRRSKK